MDAELEFSAAQIRYILCIARLSCGGCGVKNTELAEALGYSKPSVHKMLRALSLAGVVQQESFGLAHLTAEGRRIAERYRIAFLYLAEAFSEICGRGAVSERAICGVLADMPRDRIDALCRLSAPFAYRKE